MENGHAKETDLNVRLFMLMRCLAIPTLRFEASQSKLGAVQ